MIGAWGFLQSAFQQHFYVSILFSREPSASSVTANLSGITGQ
jgi:hypothetical protein